MARRVNPDVERLERENAYLREAIRRGRQDPPECPFVACDSSCLCAQPMGMMTNGGCRCNETTLRRAVMWWRARAQCLQATVIEMRDGRPEDLLAESERMRAMLEQRRAEREGAK